jgi:hypothetical protein
MKTRLFFGVTCTLLVVGLCAAQAGMISPPNGEISDTTKHDLFTDGLGGKKDATLGKGMQDIWTWTVKNSSKAIDWSDFIISSNMPNDIHFRKKTLLPSLEGSAGLPRHLRHFDPLAETLRQ